MSFVIKLKKFFNEVTDKVVSLSSDLTKVVKENNQMLDAYRSLAKESKEGIASYKTYGDKETPGLKDAFASVSAALGAIDAESAKMVAETEKKFIAPLNDLLKDWLKLNTEIREDKKAQGGQVKSEKKVASVKAKPAEKVKTGEPEAAAAQLEDATKKAAKEHEDVIVATDAFNKKKVQTLEDTLVALVSTRIAFYEKAAGLLKDIPAKIKKIDVVKENDVVIEAPKNP
jgi:hypothetical protein